MEPFRALVVDADERVSVRATRVLKEANVAVSSTRSLEEALASLDSANMVVLDDIPLPEASLGADLLSRILTEPQRFVLMTRGPGVENSLSRWADLVGNRLPKPFTSGDARGAFRRALQGLGRTVPVPRPVVVARGRDWTASLAEVLSRAGADLELVDPDKVIPRVRALRSPVAVLDSSEVSQDDLRAISAAFHADASLAVEIIFVTGEGENVPPASILSAGANRTFKIPGHVGDLTAAVTRTLGLSRRTHPRAPLRSEIVLAVPGRRSLNGETFDVAETGIGIGSLETPPFLEVTDAMFSFPGCEIRATGEVVWVKEDKDGTYRCGLRFLGLSDPLREKIYRYISDTE